MRFLLVSLFTALLAGLAPAADPPRRPNILVIVADDKYNTTQARYENDKNTAIFLLFYRLRRFWAIGGNSGEFRVINYNLLHIPVGRVTETASGNLGKTLPRENQTPGLNLKCACASVPARAGSVASPRPGPGR